MLYGPSDSGACRRPPETQPDSVGDGKRRPYGTSYHHPLAGVVLAGGLKAKL